MVEGVAALMGATHRLVVFEAVVRRGSFTQAARELGVSQPTISRQIATLERDLGTQVFRREHNRVVLTLEGELLSEHVERAMSELATGVSELRGHRGELTLALQPAIAESWITPRMQSLQRTVEPASIRVVLYDYDDEIDGVEHDVSVRFGGEPTGRSLRSRALVAETVTPVATPAFRDAHGLEAGDAEPLKADVDLLQLDPVRRRWTSWHDYFARFGRQWEAPPGNILHRSYGVLVQQALAGRGVVLGWETLLGDLVERELLVAVGPSITNPAAGYWLTWPAGLHHNPARQRLSAWLADVVSELGP